MEEHLPFPRLIAVDLDGTLLKKSKQIDERTLKAVSACRERGAALAFVTGRSFEKAREYLTLLRPEAAVLSYGAHVLVRGRTVYRRFIPLSHANQLMGAVKDARYIRYQTDAGVRYTDWPGESCRPLSRAKPVRFRLDHLCAWELPEAAARSAAHESGCSLTQLCADRWCNFSAPGCSKERGLQKALSFLRLPPGCAIGFGDEDCDIAFGRLCGTLVAMKNADQRTLGAADYITESNENAGIAAFLYRYIL